MFHHHLQCLLGKVVFVLNAMLPAVSLGMNLLNNWPIQSSHRQAQIAGSCGEHDHLNGQHIAACLAFSNLPHTPERSGLGAPPAKPVVDRQRKPFGSFKSLHSFSLLYPSIIRCNPADAISPATCSSRSPVGQVDLTAYATSSVRNMQATTTVITTRLACSVTVPTSLIEHTGTPQSDLNHLAPCQFLIAGQ